MLTDHSDSFFSYIYIQYNVNQQILCTSSSFPPWLLKLSCPKTVVEHYNNVAADIMSWSLLLNVERHAVAIQQVAGFILPRAKLIYNTQFYCCCIEEFSCCHKLKQHRGSQLFLMFISICILFSLKKIVNIAVTLIRVSVSRICESMCRQLGTNFFGHYIYPFIPRIFLQDIYFICCFVLAIETGFPKMSVNLVC